jgi:hypothetical protein
MKEHSGNAEFSRSKSLAAARYQCGSSEQDGSKIALRFDLLTELLAVDSVTEAMR